LHNTIYILSQSALAKLSVFDKFHNPRTFAPDD
jgi:hypothetical protein